MVEGCSGRWGGGAWRGGPGSFWHQVIRAAINKWEKMCKDDDEGLRPVHRAREWHLAARRLEKERKREDW